MPSPTSGAVVPTKRQQQPQPQQAPQKPNAGEAILAEARGAHATSQRLLPLLDLLQEGSEEGGPLDAIKEMLEAILLSQRHLMGAVEDLDRKLDALAGRRKPSPQ